MSDTTYDRLLRADRRLVEALRRGDPDVKIRAYYKDVADARWEWEYAQRVNTGDLIANISRGEEALKGIEPGATFEIADLYGKEN